jgi:cytidine deaminase
MTAFVTAEMMMMMMMIMKTRLRFEVFKAVTLKNGVFWDLTPCGSCWNRRFGGT